ncbi:helix-turn-helix transcriptional regulator [Nocardia iowensis]|uniref:Helix-turn-helix domain-containing protein n=1 Tax=Nocardia iowensis TaxID=204891 RepID=A0ABX8RQK0_NOCIO|nr:helix-turn-helix transcriptional regulator [Nocardia iowensis]QXN91873.1 helix-turn-helix domain-containing protein [Nocardia iowensis]
MRLTSGETLRALMRQRGDTMDSLARKAGCSRSFIGQLCKEAKRSCTPELAARIAEALAVPSDLLFVSREHADSDIYTRSVSGAM